MANNKIIAYHGTSDINAHTIRAEQHFHESRQPIEWLGWGIYFFPYKLHAERWAKNRWRRHGVVLTVQLEYDDGQMLDLDDPLQLEMVNDELADLENVIRKEVRLSTEAMDKPDQWKYWCFGCNLYRKLHPEIGITSYTFSPYNRNKIGASQFRANQKQLCVSKHEIITKII